MKKRKNGVTLAVVTYNGRTRLPETLSYIANQVVSTDVEWEVLVIDNASTDGTEEFLRNLRDPVLTSRLRVIKELQPGALHARMRAVQEADYDIISYIDDDNWVCGSWVEKVAAVFKAHPKVGILGSASEAAPQGPQPEFLDRVWHWLAVGKQVSESGLVHKRPVSFWTAGTSFRVAAFDTLFELGLRPGLKGRSGKKRAGGEDLEMCLMVVLLGWKVYFEETLVFRHAIPTERLTREVIADQIYQGGKSHAVLDVYRCEFPNGPSKSQLLRFSRHLRFFLRCAAAYYLKRIWGSLPPLSYNEQSYLNSRGKVVGYFENREKVTQAKQNLKVLLGYINTRSE